VATWLRAEFWPNEKRDGRGIIMFDELPIWTSAAIMHLPCGLSVKSVITSFRPVGGQSQQATVVDRAAANSISTALANRFAHIHVRPDYACWRHGLWQTAIWIPC
jgi:hypothetical protein